MSQKEPKIPKSPAAAGALLTVYEEASVIEARIARLEDLLSSTSIVDRDFDGRVDLGCTVRVANEGAGQAEYEGPTDGGELYGVSREAE